VQNHTGKKFVWPAQAANSAKLHYTVLNSFYVVLAVHSKKLSYRRETALQPV